MPTMTAPRRVVNRMPYTVADLAAAAAMFAEPSEPDWPKPNIHVMSRKVTEHPAHKALAPNSTPVGDFASRSGDTKSP